MTPAVPPLITVDEAATLLKVTAEEVEAGVHRGEIPVTADRGHLYIDSNALLADLGIAPDAPIALVPNDSSAAQHGRQP